MLEARFSTVLFHWKMCFKGLSNISDKNLDSLVTLREMLAGSHDDPAQTAARNLDWVEFLGELDECQLTMLGDVAVGEPMWRSLLKQRVTYEYIRHVRRSLAEEVKECFGEDVLAEVVKKPAWWGDLHAERKRAACRVH